MRSISKTIIGATAFALLTAAGLWMGAARAQQTPTRMSRAGVDPAAMKKHVLVLGFAYGWHHGSITDTEAMVWQLGHDTGLFDVEIRTDPAWITKDYTGGGLSRNLDWFDAIVAADTTGVWPLTDQQKKDFISFIHDDGKGFVGIHAALDANHDHVWPEYTEMIGGEFAAHPWLTFAAPVIIEDPSFPAMRHFGATHLTIYDEMYMAREDDWSRDKVNVLMRLDESKLPPPGGQEPYASESPVAAQAAGVPLLAMPQPSAAPGRGGRGAAPAPVRVRADRDIAIAWAKMYGKGRVFYSSLGHTRENIANPDVRKMYLEAIKWALGLEDGSTATHPRRD
jgi:uncharacterized protein